MSCSTAVQLFAGKLDSPRDLLLFQLLGCENILVFVVSQKKTENLMWAFGALPHEFHQFIRSACNEYKTMQRCFTRPFSPPQVVKGLAHRLTHTHRVSTCACTEVHAGTAAL